MVYDNTNIFAKILAGELPCNKVGENSVALAFHDIYPAAPVHLIIIPKGSYSSYDDFTAHATDAEIIGFHQLVQQMARLMKLQDEGYRLITNHGKNASQTVAHFHMHLLGGKNLGGLLQEDMHLR
jgi:histidine triad (HIT) family protein